VPMSQAAAAPTPEREASYERSDAFDIAQLWERPALAGIVATGRVLGLGAVMRDLQNDINSSPDPYQTGIGYGRRFCIWIGSPSPLRRADAGRSRNRSAPARPFTTIYRDLRDFTRQRAVERK
jgi:hypothetical protein